MVCYVSSFHLSINDWFSEYENIEILKDNLSNRLGTYPTIKRFGLNFVIRHQIICRIYY